MGLLGLFGLFNLLGGGKYESQIRKEIEEEMKNKYVPPVYSECKRVLLDLKCPCRVCGESDHCILDEEGKFNIISCSKTLKRNHLRQFSLVCCQICGHIEMFLSKTLEKYDENKKKKHIEFQDTLKKERDLLSNENNE